MIYLCHIHACKEIIMDATIITEVAIAAISLVLAVMGFILVLLYNNNKSTEDALNDHKVLVARDYVPRTEMKNITDAIDRRMDKMESWIGRRFDALMGQRLPTKDD